MLFAHDVITLMDPVMQCGFAGMSVLLLGIVIWGGKRLFGVLEGNSKVIKANTMTIDKINDSIGRHETEASKRHRESQIAIHDMREKLIAKLAANGVE